MKKVLSVGKEHEPDIQRGLDFMVAADGACLMKDVTFFFECPLCGGEAKARKCSENGHIMASCVHCNTQVIQ